MSATATDQHHQGPWHQAAACNQAPTHCLLFQGAQPCSARITPSATAPKFVHPTSAPGCPSTLPYSHHSRCQRGTGKACSRLILHLRREHRYCVGWLAACIHINESEPHASCTRPSGVLTLFSRAFAHSWLVALRCGCSGLDSVVCLSSQSWDQGIGYGQPLSPIPAPV